MKSHILAPLAEEDLTDIWFHVLENDGVDRADQVVDDIESAIAHLCRHPDTGHERTDIGIPRDVNLWPVHEFLIVFLPEKDPLWIARIWHGKRDPRGLVVPRPPNE